MASVSFKHVLAGIDFSEWTPGVVGMAGALSARYEAALTVVYADTFLPPPYFTERSLERVSEALNEQKAEAQKTLDETVAEILGHSDRVKTRVVEAMPVDGIKATAAAVGADLIVLGTHGRSGLNRLMMGSVAEKVVRSAEVPVLTVRGFEGGGQQPFGKILCPVNFSEVSYDAFAYAVDLANRFACPLVALASYEDEQETSSGRLDDLMERLCQLKPSGVSCAFEPIVRRGQAAEQILRAARDQGIGLIVQGALHRPLLETTILGTTSVRVMRHAECPVLTVPKR